MAYASRSEAQVNGWFSRMHRTGEAHSGACQLRRERLEQRASIAFDNAQARAKRSPAEQLAVLDKRLGKDVGAKLERARLVKQIQVAKQPKVVKVEKPDALAKTVKFKK